MTKQEEFLKKFFSDFSMTSFAGDYCANKSAAVMVMEFIKKKGLSLDSAKHSDLRLIDSKYSEVLLHGGKLNLNFISPDGQKVRMVYFRSVSNMLEPLLFFVEQDALTQISAFQDKVFVGAKASTIIPSEDSRVYRSDLKVSYEYVKPAASIVKELPTETRLEVFKTEADSILEQSFQELEGSFMKEVKTGPNFSKLVSVIDLFNDKIDNSVIESEVIRSWKNPPSTDLELQPFQVEFKQMPVAVMDFIDVSKEVISNLAAEIR